LERHRATRERDYYRDNYLAAQRKVQELVDEYNNVACTPHSATSNRENSTSEIQASDEKTVPHKLLSARHRRRVYNRSQMAA